MRTLSPTAVLSLNAQEDGNAWWYLVEIEHPELVGSYRFVNNTTDVTSGGRVWTAFPFALTLALDDGQTLPSVELQFSNIDRTLIDVIRGLTSAPTVHVFVVLSSQPDVVEMRLTDMQLTDVAYDVSSVTGRLVKGDLLNAPYPCDSYDPAQFPAVFY